MCGAEAERACGGQLIGAEEWQWREPARSTHLPNLQGKGARPPGRWVVPAAAGLQAGCCPLLTEKYLQGIGAGSTARNVML